MLPPSTKQSIWSLMEIWRETSWFPLTTKCGNCKYLCSSLATPNLTFKATALGSGYPTLVSLYRQLREVLGSLSGLKWEEEECACHVGGERLQCLAACLEWLCRAGSVSWLCAGWEVWNLVPECECTSKPWHHPAFETDTRPTVTDGTFFSRHKCKGINHREASQKLKFIYWLWGVKRQMWSVGNMLRFPAI